MIIVLGLKSNDSFGRFIRPLRCQFFGRQVPHRICVIGANFPDNLYKWFGITLIMYVYASMDNKFVCMKLN